MTIRKSLSCLFVAGAICAATAAHAGKDTVPNTVSVFSPAAVVTVQAAFQAVRSGTASATTNADGSVTVTFASGATTTFTSSFISGFIAAYL